MTKPWWGQTWEVGAPGPCGGRVVRVEANGDRNIIADEIEDDAEHAMAAAPEMARALLAVLEWDEMQRAVPDVAVLSPIAAVRAAIAKAGVPLP